MKIDGCAAVVTGGASGLGEACVRHLVAEGGRVAIFDRSAEAGAALAGELGCLFRQVDVTDAEAVKAALDDVRAAFGALHVAINCAGIAVAAKTLGRDGPHDLDLWRKTLEVNLTGSFNIARLAAEFMAENDAGPDGERGVILHTASVAAFEGQKGQPAYAASKGGIAGMVLPMARDLASLGIRVNAIAPGLFMTPMMAGLPEAAQQALSEQPLFPKRLGDPAEFADLAAFLITNRYMNGTVLRIDGGVRLP